MGGMCESDTVLVHLGCCDRPQAGETTGQGDHRLGKP